MTFNSIAVKEDQDFRHSVRAIVIKARSIMIKTILHDFIIVNLKIFFKKLIDYQTLPLNFKLIAIAIIIFKFNVAIIDFADKIYKVYSIVHYFLQQLTKIFFKLSLTLKFVKLSVIMLVGLTAYLFIIGLVIIKIALTITNTVI